MDVWRNCNITLRVRKVSSSKLLSEYSGNFDFSQYIPIVQLQFVVTRNLASFQQFMKKKNYDSLVNENSIQVSLSGQGNRKIDIEVAGDDLCSTLSKFMVSYTSKPVLVPENSTSKYDEILQEIDHKNLACGVYMESDSNCYWLAGQIDDVIQAYKIFQEKVPDLWYDIPSTAVETKLSPFTPSMNHNINEDFDIKFEIDTGTDQRIITRGGTFRATKYLDMPVVQFMLSNDINYFRHCMKTAGLSYKVKGQTLKVAIKSNTTCSDFDEIGVKLTNLVVHISLLHANNLLKVDEKIVKDFNTKLREYITSKEGTLYADCFWRRDKTALWVVSRAEHIHKSYSMLNTVYESCVFYPESAQSPVESEHLATQTSNIVKDYEMSESWNRMIEVRGATEALSADTMEFYFDNKRRSGGGDVEEVKFEDGVFIVTFKTPDAVDRVLERTHTLSGVKLQVKRHLPSQKIPEEKAAPTNAATVQFTPVYGCLKPIGRFPGEYKTQEGILVKVYCGSITSLSVDCIVNAANEQLAHGGGVAYAISRAAGYDFDRESREYIQKNGHLKVGECCTTSAGNLNYACIIHTVGPRWSGYRDKSECLNILKQSVEVTFIEAEKFGLISLAVPAISSGVFGVPNRDCAEQYYRAVISYSRNRSNTNLKEIHFVDIDPGMISVIQDTFGEMIKNYPGDTSQNGVNNSTVCTNQGTRNIVDVTTLSMNLRHGELKFRASDNIEVLLYQGKIEETKVEAVVCPQDKKFSGSGQIAKAKLGAVDGVHGEDAVKSLKSSTKYGYISEVKVLKSESVASHWNYIIHAVCPRWNEHAIKDPKSYKKDLDRTLWKCLDAVKDWKINSVAFPLLGAALQPLATPLDICAKCLTEAISRTQFFKPVEIHVVCYDQSALDAYQKVISGTFEKITAPMSDVQEAGKTSFSRAGRSFSAKQEGCDTEQIDDKTPTITADCCICMYTATNPKTLSKCGHTFCSDCIDQYFKGYKPVCPNCGQVYGKVKGDQPDGQIYITKSGVSLPGHEGSGSIKVTYSFKDGQQGPDHPSPGKQYQGIERSGHLPDNTKGRIVAKLLNVAFTRRLVFTIGRSRTTGQEGVLTWNDIHHKTRTYGGPERFGYPDPTYLDRVLDELAVKGVTEESADDPNEYRQFTRCFRH